MKEWTPSAAGNGSAASTTEQTQSESPVEDTTPQPTRHLVVGIGASAGGLAAFQAFFAAMPADSGMAFVLVQHLDPDYNSALAEILTAYTAMPVVKAVDGTPAAPNTVSVIPPNSILKIQQGVLRVATAESATARRSSIDTFLISLAEDRGEDAIGIILSGYGSDGSNGIAAIKECGGLTLSEAEFDHQAKLGMPQSAAAGGFVDQVLQVQDMPSALLEFQRQQQQRALSEAEPDVGKQLATICSVLHSRLGRDFADYKTNTLIRRVHRRMQILRIADIARYIEQLRTLPDEAELLFRELLIGVTRFFRDASMFEALAQTVVQPLVAKEVNGREPIRVWVAGCATGEEAYSIAILFKEALLRAESTQRVKIFATDIDERAIGFARAGLYSDVIEGDLTAERLAQHFTQEGNRYRVSKQIREMCVFSAHDLTKDPPFSNLDLVSCRNLLIYFEARLQKRVLATFHYSLKSQGVLWLGPSETVLTSGRFFKALDKKRRLFRRIDIPVELPRTLAHEPWSRRASPSVQPDSRALEDEVNHLLTTFAPAYVIVDARLEIHKFSGPIAKFLEPVSGSAKLNLSRLLHAGLRSPAAALVRKATEDQRRIEETLRLR